MVSAFNDNQKLFLFGYEIILKSFFSLAFALYLVIVKNTFKIQIIYTDKRRLRNVLFFCKISKIQDKHFQDTKHKKSG